MGDLLLKGFGFMLDRSRDPEALAVRLLHAGRRLCGLQTRYQKSGALTWPYLRGGRGVPVVLLHGFGADKDRFGSLVPFLRRSFEMIIPDIPGFGDHAPDWSLSYDLEAQVTRFAEFIHGLGLQRFHLMGLSLGGYLAAYYAARYPGQVRTLALVDSAGFSSDIPSDAQRLFESRGRNIFLYAGEQELQELMDYLLYQPIKLPAAVRRYWTVQGLARRRWREKLFADLMAGGLHRMDTLAPAITAPTLVIWGADDRVCHVSTVDRILALIEDCRACVIHRCGHIPMIEYPQMFRRLYTAFITSNRF